MTHLLVPIAFLLGALGGGALVWHWRGRRGPDGGPDRWQKWKLVGATAVLTTLALGAAGYALVRHFFRPTRASRATVRQAVADYRKTTGSSRSESRGRTPPGGVYQYRATGFYEITAPVLGKERRDLPATVPAVLVADGDCWELTLRYFKVHHSTARYCWDPSVGLRRIWTRNKNTIFSMKNRSQSSCTPDVLLRPRDRPGREWKPVCKPDKPGPHSQGTRLDLVVRYVGVEPVIVGGRKVRSHHLRRTGTATGTGTGSFRQDQWFADSTGMLVRLRVKGRGSGMAEFVSEYELTLKSLEPAR